MSTRLGLMNAERIGLMNPFLDRYAGRFPFSVQERDIDLLILEQLHVSMSFTSWLVEHIGLPDSEVLTANHSVHRQHGETDVLLFVRHQEQKIAVMIEDKIGAPMQPDQCERYHIRGEILCREGDANRYLTVLCAPSSYISGISREQRWDYRLPLELLAQKMADAANPGWEWRQAILLTASSKASRAREADDRSNRAYDTKLLELKLAYQGYVQGHYPQLIASRQEGRDREYYLKGVGLPSGIRFKHSFFRGEISIIFEKKWVTTADDWLSENLPEGAWISRHGSELHVRMATEVMDPLLTLGEQEEIVGAALDQICVMSSYAEASYSRCQSALNIDP